MPVEVIATRQAVFEAASELLRDGVFPTCSKVRARIDGGSYTSISAHLAEFRRTLPQAAAAQAAPVPERVQAAANKCAQTLWAEFNAEVTARAAQEQEAARQRVSEAELQLGDALHEVRTLEARLQGSIETSRGLKADLESIRDQLVKAEALADQFSRDLAIARAAERTAIEDAAMLRGAQAGRRTRARKAGLPS